MKHEIITQAPIQIIRSESGASYLSGYAAVWFDGTPGSTYKPLPNVVETVSRSAFDKVLQGPEPIEAWYNHDPAFVLATTRDKSLTLEADAKGLRFWILYDDQDPDHSKVAAKLRKGYATGASFQAMVSTSLTKEGSTYRRSIDQVDALREISIVNNPAYTGTSATLRADLDRWEESQKRILRAKAYIG